MRKATVCLRGHLRTPENLYGRATCRICALQRAKAYQIERNERYTHYQKKYKHERSGYLAKYNFYHALKRKYKITVSEYEELLTAQKGVCAICKQPCRTGHHLAVDHCHKTGRVRGLLCLSCNSRLAVLENPLFPHFQTYLARFSYEIAA